MKCLILVSAFMVLGACGSSNMFEAIDDQAPEDQATVALEKGDSDEAISILESALADDPENYLLSSLLSSAKAQKAGVDTIDFALGLATTGGSADIESLFGVVPDATSDNIALLQEATDLLNAIPEAERHAADSFKLSIFYTSLLTLRTKLYDSDGDGNLSAEELLELDDASAIAILENLSSAEGALANYTSDDGGEDAVSVIGELADAIASSEGDSEAEQLRNFLSDD